MSNKYIIFSIMILSLALLNLKPLFAQKSSMPTLFESSAKDSLIIIGSSGVGAILGLSTLSFVEEPSDHFRSILVGASLGIIVGVIVVAYNQANRSRMDYYENALPQDASFIDSTFSTSDRVAWHNSSYKEIRGLDFKGKIPLFFGHTFSF